MSQLMEITERKRTTLVTLEAFRLVIRRDMNFGYRKRVTGNLDKLCESLGIEDTYTMDEMGVYHRTYPVSILALEFWVTLDSDQLYRLGVC